MRKVRFNWADFIIWFVLGLFALIALYPFIYVLAGSFNDGMDYSAGGIWLFPREVTLANYSVVLMDDDFWHAFGNTVLITAVGTVCALLFTSVVAYAMSRRELRFRNFFQIANLFTMFFSGGLIPYFMIIVLLGLYDNFLVYIIPSIYSVYNMIVLQSGFKSISSDIHDAALIDGAGEFRIWWQIYMPLSKPVLATIVLWVAVGHWNSYFDTMIYTNSEELQSLQYFLLKAIQTSSMTEGMPPEMMERLSSQTLSLAAIILSIIPVFCFFPLIRKNFASGIMVGSLKG